MEQVVSNNNTSTITTKRHLTGRKKTERNVRSSVQEASANLKVVALPVKSGYFGSRHPFLAKNTEVHETGTQNKAVPKEATRARPSPTTGRKTAKSSEDKRTLKELKPSVSRGRLSATGPALVLRKI